jgi:hypothetical protein
MTLVLDLSRCSGTLSTLALACVLVLLTICPALADFDSAVAAYEDGRYQEAQTEFEDLAAAGDERAQPYLTRIHKKLGDGPQDRGVASSAERLKADRAKHAIATTANICFFAFLLTMIVPTMIGLYHIINAAG